MEQKVASDTGDISPTDVNNISITTSKKEIGFDGLLVINVHLSAGWSGCVIYINDIPIFSFGNGYTNNRTGTPVSMSNFCRVKSTDTIYVSPNSSGHTITSAKVYSNK